MLRLAVASDSTNTHARRAGVTGPYLGSLVQQLSAAPAGKRREPTAIDFSDACDGMHLWTKKQQMRAAPWAGQCAHFPASSVNLNAGDVMYPIDLTVPETERGLALELGARWHQKYEVWYVPRTFNAQPLGRWLTARAFPNMRSKSLWLARVFGTCPWCENAVPMHGLILPAGHQVLCPADEPAEDAWEIAEEPSQLYEVGYLSAPLQAALQAHAPTYRLGYSELLERFCWINYCRHCRGLIEDEQCALEFGSPLNPLDEIMAARIGLQELRLEVEASCARYSCGVQLFEEMPRWST
jgi:hypothetical protein